MLTFTQAQQSQLRAHLEAGYPNEACGILLGDLDLATNHRVVREVVPVANVWAGDPGAEGAHSQRDRYTISPEDVARADRRGQARLASAMISGRYSKCMLSKWYHFAPQMKPCFSKMAAIS